MVVTANVANGSKSVPNGSHSLLDFGNVPELCLASIGAHSEQGPPLAPRNAAHGILRLPCHRAQVAQLGHLDSTSPSCSPTAPLYESASSIPYQGQMTPPQPAGALSLFT